jgi:hypothetical protein
MNLDAESGMESNAQSNANVVPIKRQRRAPSRAVRPRSAVTSGRQLFVKGGDAKSAWSRRFHDLILCHISDLGGTDMLTEAKFSLIRRASAIECELERLDARLSRGEYVDMDAYARVAGHLRRMFETLGVERKPRDVTPTLNEIAEEIAAGKRGNAEEGLS